MREPIIDTMQIAGVEFDVADIKRHIEQVRSSGIPGGFIILVNVNDDSTAEDGLPAGRAFCLGEDDLHGA